MCIRDRGQQSLKPMSGVSSGHFCVAGCWTSWRLVLFRGAASCWGWYYLGKLWHITFDSERERSEAHTNITSGLPRNSHVTRRSFDERHSFNSILHVHVESLDRRRSTCTDRYIYEFLDWLQSRVANYHQWRHTCKLSLALGSNESLDQTNFQITRKKFRSGGDTSCTFLDLRTFLILDSKRREII